jgi:hypothetical protein
MCEKCDCQKDPKEPEYRYLIEGVDTHDLTNKGDKDLREGTAT